jgi:magnesium-protoporphyrin IX monomethyl ester (oxidative) cyclase
MAYALYRYLEKNQISEPNFRFFESWCQDENRHGDFFAAILKSQKTLVKIRIKIMVQNFSFCFATMYLNDLQRTDFTLRLV